MSNSEASWRGGRSGESPPTLFAAAASAKVTPKKPLPLAGYAERRQYGEGVAKELEVSVLLLRTLARRAVLVSLDLLYVGDLRRRILQKLRASLGEEELLTAATHTHFGPATDPRLPLLGEADDEYLEATSATVAALIDEVVATPATAVRIRYGESDSDLNVNRRERVLYRSRSGWPVRFGTQLRVNSNGPRDPRIRTLEFVRSGDGSTLAIVWSWACHPVGFPTPNHISPEFPGEVRDALRGGRSLSPCILFFQGFSGDVRPQPPTSQRRARGPKILSALRGQCFSAFDIECWQRWCDALARDVETALARARWIAEGALSTARTQLPLSVVMRGADPDATLMGHAVSLGEELVLLGVSGEPVTAHVTAAEHEFPGRVVIPISSIDAAFGYLPTSQMLLEGGYEADGFRPYFGLETATFVDPDAAVRRLVLALQAGLARL